MGLGDEEDPVPVLEQAPEAREQRRDLIFGTTVMSMDRLARSLNSSRPVVAVVTEPGDARDARVAGGRRLR